MFEDLRRIPNYTPSVGANGRSPLLDMVVLRKSCVCYLQTNRRNPPHPGFAVKLIQLIIYRYL